MTSRSRPGNRHCLRSTGIALLTLVALAVGGSFFIDEPRLCDALWFGR
jgi:hypothetical protein